MESKIAVENFFLFWKTNDRNQQAIVKQRATSAFNKYNSIPPRSQGISLELGVGKALGTRLTQFYSCNDIIASKMAASEQAIYCCFQKLFLDCDKRWWQRNSPHKLIVLWILIQGYILTKVQSSLKVRCKGNGRFPPGAQCRTCILP